MDGMFRGTQVLVVMLLALTAACHKKDPKEAQLQALEEAYKSGVFTKEEYEAKKQALIATSAAAPAPASTPAPAAAVPADAGQPAPPSADAAAASPAPDVNPMALPPPDTASAPAPSAAAPAQALPAPAGAPPAAQPVQAQPVQAYPTQPPQAVPPVRAAPSAPAAEPEPAPLAGCQDAESRAGGPNGTQERFYVASEDAVRSAAVKAFANLGFAIHNSTTHDMEASKKGKLNTVVGAGTERVILHFANAHRNGQAGTRVVGETKRGFMGRVTQKSWTSAVLAQIGCNLRR